MTPYPGTALYDLAVREGYYTKNESYADMNVMVLHMETPEIPSRKVSNGCRSRLTSGSISGRAVCDICFPPPLVPAIYIRDLANYAATAAGYFRKSRTEALKRTS